jgi:hypothetical protein
LNANNFSFAQDGDKLFIQDILAGDCRWAITPAFAVSTTKYRAPTFYYPPHTFSFWQSLTGCLLKFAAGAFAATAPLLYIRRRSKTPSPSDIPA